MYLNCLYLNKCCLLKLSESNVLCKLGDILKNVLPLFKTMLFCVPALPPLFCYDCVVLLSYLSLVQEYPGSQFSIL